MNAALRALVQRLEERIHAPRPRDPARLAAIRAAHPELLADLDEHQLAAVVADDPVCVVEAHVGSGKTRVLAHRALYLHLACGVPLAQIVIATFTQRVAGELRARLEARLGPLPAEALAGIGTFHAVAHALLARRGARADVLDAAGREALLAELVDAHRLRVCYRRRLGRRLEALRRGRERVGAMRHPDEVRALDALYTAEKRRRNLVDFDDLIEQATAMCRAAPAPPRHLLIDELQDCGSRELALVRALRGPGTALFAVGDPQQAIYGWRGAAASGFAQLAG